MHHTTTCFHSPSNGCDVQDAAITNIHNLLSTVWVNNLNIAKKYGTLEHVSNSCDDRKLMRLDKLQLDTFCNIYTSKFVVFT